MRIVSGMRPTGLLHIGHLLGALTNWKKLQDEKNDCFFFVADWHALTTDFKNTAQLPNHVREMVMDWLAAGIDPTKSTLFLQSAIREHAELYLMFSMITPLGWLERNPTYKELKQENTDRDLSNLGFLGYPVLQAADILLYKGQAVPVGQDQVPHLELSREIARRFNNTYGEMFPEPQPKLTPSPKISGIDGRKMSKSYGNAILLADPETEVQAKIKVMVTDPKRARRKDPGDPDTCNLYPLHEAYSSSDTIQNVRKGCVSAEIGCVDCKKMLLDSMLPTLGKIRAKREEISQHPKRIEEILQEGNRKAQSIATQTMDEVKKVIHLAS